MDDQQRMGGVNPPRHGEGDRQPTAGGGGGVPPTRRPETYTARKLRREMTFPEVVLWQRLRAQKAGVKFRRQHPIGPYVADFYCTSLKLVLEVDGEVHNQGDNPQRDIRRDAFLKENGYQVIRIPAVDILKDVEMVVQTIAALGANPLHQPAAGPPPLQGEESA